MTNLVDCEPAEKTSAREMQIVGYWAQLHPLKGAGFSLQPARTTKVDGKEGKSCKSCHGDAAKSMKGVGARYPVYYERWKKMINVENRINLCREKFMKAKLWKYDSNQMLGMTIYVKHQSRGMPVNVKVDGPAKPFFEKGKSFYYERRDAV